MNDKNVRFSLTRRWISSRPGSVLILVIALLVLLALIGTAYLSSTQTERYTSVQNTVNTQADLLVDGLVVNIESKITNGLYGTGSNSGTFRAPTQENTTTTVTSPALPGSGYNTFTSPQSEDYLADRVPTISPATGVPTWGAISWPPFTDSASYPNYSFDSPFATSSQLPTPLYSLINKPNILSIPTYKTINGRHYPAMLYYVLPNTSISYSSNAGANYTAGPGGAFLIAPTALNQNPFVQANSGSVPSPYNVVQNPDMYAPLSNLAASAAGDGIADAGMFKIPIGPIDGVTYYAGVRVIDDNSAVNVSTAWTAAVDPPLTSITEPLANASTTTPIYGFFRSNIGLRELLNTPVDYAPLEMDHLNSYRFNGNLVPSYSPLYPGTPVTPRLGTYAPFYPYADSGSARNDFLWFSVNGTTHLAGDMLETQLARRPLFPGLNTSSTSRFLYMDKAQSAALAYKFSLMNPSSSLSPIEQLLPYETTYSTLGASYTSSTYPSTPYSPTQIGTAYSAATPNVAGTWYGDLFDFHQFNSSWTGVSTPERTILTASNPVSNGIASRLGYASSGSSVYSATNTYNFGDWVTRTIDAKSFICLQPILTKTGVDANGVSTALPTLSTTVTSNQYWAYVPFSSQPVKTSINTATFEQLWTTFCQVMTDEIALPGSADEMTGSANVPQWQPPKLLTTLSQYGEQQIPQFRSVIRDNRTYPLINTGNTGQPGSPPGNTAFMSIPAQTPKYSTNIGGRVQLTPMQMVQLRAAIASINTVSARSTNTDASLRTTRIKNGPEVTGGNPVQGNPPGTHVRMTRSRRVILPDSSGNPAFQVEVFGNDIQPYINQMYAYVSDPTNATSFIALQLINPDTSADITVGTGWAFASIDRTAVSPKGPGFPNLSLTLVSRGNSTLKIPKATMAVGTGTNNVVLPGSVVFYDGTPPAGFVLPKTNAYAVAGLHETIGLELVLLRPRQATASGATLSTSPPGTPYFDKFNEAYLYDLVPVDQLDMTGANNVTTPRNHLYYRRAASPAPTASGGSSAWNFAWPGFYTPYNTHNAATAPQMPPAYTASSSPLSTYTLNQAIIVSATAPHPGIPTAVVAAPPANGANPDFTSLCTGAADTTAANGRAPTFSTVTLQLMNTAFPGINPINSTGGAKNCFPFGGFARNVDMLQIPYIGAYRISDYYMPMGDLVNNPTNAFYEMNSITMDASLANDLSLQVSADTPVTTYPSKVISTGSADLVTDPFVEQIGHFCPVGDTAAATYAYPTVIPNNRLLDFGTDPKSWHYHWTKKLFDYFTVQAPNDDYFPNGADPDVSYASYGDVQKYAPILGPSPAVAPIQNSTSTTANVAEDMIGVEGLININTAPWPVLATLPFLPRNATNTGTPLTDSVSYVGITSAPNANTAVNNQVDDNVDIAKAIVDYRNLNGPFKTIFDLYKVPTFRLVNDFLLKSAEPGYLQGDFSPGGIFPTVATNATDGARFDFEERFLLLNRISNLITTRSDTFTCYVDLQGWRNVGSGNPTLAVERRRAFIFDRNAYTPANKNPIYFPIPTGE